jgi:hypothetical protein
MKTMKHTCGHESEIPANMGRGAARQARLDAHYSRPCLDCRRAAIAVEAAKMCVLMPGADAAGKRNMRRYNADEIAAYVAKHVR